MLVRRLTIVGLVVLVVGGAAYYVWKIRRPSADVATKAVDVATQRQFDAGSYDRTQFNANSGRLTLNPAGQ